MRWLIKLSGAACTSAAESIRLKNKKIAGINEELIFRKSRKLSVKLRERIKLT